MSDEVVKIVMLARLVGELADLIGRAAEAGRREVTNAELDAVFERAEAAEARWLAAGRKRGNEPPEEERPGA